MLWDYGTSFCDVSNALGTDVLDSNCSSPDPQLVRRIVSQVEFYLSDENLAKDAFLLKHVQKNKMGFVSIKLLTSFKKVKYLTRDWRLTLYALQFSELLEVNEEGTKVRRRVPVPESLLSIPPSKLLLAWELLPQEQGLPSVVQKYASRFPELLSKCCALVEYESLESARRAFEDLGRQSCPGGESIRVVRFCGKGSRKKSGAEREAVEELVEPRGWKHWGRDQAVLHVQKATNSRLCPSCSARSFCDVSNALGTDVLDSNCSSPDPQLVRRIVSQVEFYLSDENLAKDAFLLKHVQKNKMGFVSIKLLTSFKKVKYLTRDWRLTLYALQFSELLEVNEEGTKVRRRVPVPDIGDSLLCSSLESEGAPASPCLFLNKQPWAPAWPSSDFEPIDFNTFTGSLLTSKVFPPLGTRLSIGSCSGFCSSTETLCAWGSGAGAWVPWSRSPSPAAKPSPGNPAAAKPVPEPLGLRDGVLRLPHGPDGTKGFCSSFGRGELVLWH
nr:PREDICTED: uncharacterized protein LOC104327324 [Opisthocomus hoazin]